MPGVPALHLRPRASLGTGKQGDWFQAVHHFTFGVYFNAKRRGWGDLVVWNDDTIKPGSGVDFHPHKNMEIITYVYQGAVSHLDSFGNRGRTEAGSVQVMNAGTGLMHSEYNLEDIPSRIFQIWIKPGPGQRDKPPQFGTRKFPTSIGFTALASGFPEDQPDALPIRTPSRVMGATLKAGNTIVYALGGERLAYLVPARGKIRVNKTIVVNAHDGLAIQSTPEISINAIEDTELVLVDTIPGDGKQFI